MFFAWGLTHLSLVYGYWAFASDSLRQLSKTTWLGPKDFDGRLPRWTTKLRNKGGEMGDLHEPCHVGWWITSFYGKTRGRLLVWMFHDMV